VAVEVEEFKQRENGVIYLRACIYVERDGQKAILIGKGGGMLKDISSLARQDIEKFLQTRLFMEVQVKVWEGWRKDPTALRRFGYRIESR
jgi:GTP-binding protein Era